MTCVHDEYIAQNTQMYTFAPVTSAYMHVKTISGLADAFSIINHLSAHHGDGTGIDKSSPIPWFCQHNHPHSVDLAKYVLILPC